MDFGNRDTIACLFMMSTMEDPGALLLRFTSNSFNDLNPTIDRITGYIIALIIESTGIFLLSINKHYRPSWWNAPSHRVIGKIVFYSMVN
ncbi:hypothetical protein SUGI_0501210 [Cryptomeria japonica]|nr:hypothetical protein SUGI_0501210 [Cryptomeria japonica]